MIPPEFMPLPNTDGAPSFTGSPYEIDDFLRHFEYLCDRRGIVYHEMCQSVPEYTTEKIRTLWENLPEHKAGNWEAYKARILSLYPERDPGYRQSHGALMRLIRRQARMEIDRLSEFAEYNREFLWIASWRVKQGYMTESKRDEYFADGIHKDLLSEARSLLKRRHTGPKRKSSDPWPHKDLADACIEVLMTRDTEDRGSVWDSDGDHDRDVDEYDYKVAARHREIEEAKVRHHRLEVEQENIRDIAATVKSGSETQAQTNTLVVQMLRYLVEAVSQVTSVPLPAWAAA
ncbi:hypothetical protein SISNIDRAFT_468116 [Sistotremastrum niveocremeum HHB9708]|uniref:Uncharacterized protein n=1 Tax=Sistotremastrum niveocremeum HHB9708 TaxID=1314777 RepID=A0A164RTH5_9AGAM|nr:hypothetical protein SISNIDRAFT_468116 [Sistotremastrum niveocremeum HHB9708]